MSVQLEIRRYSFGGTTAPKAPAIDIRYFLAGLRSRERASRRRRSHAWSPWYETAPGPMPPRAASRSAHLGPIPVRRGRALVRRGDGIRRALTTDTTEVPRRP